MQEDRALELHIKGAKAQRATGSLAAVGKGFGQDVVQTFAARLHTLLQIARLGDDLIIGEGLILRLQRVDLRHERADGFHLAVVRGAEHLPR